MKGMEETKILERYIKEAMETLYEKDEILFQEEISERCLVYNFARYLENILKETEYKDLNIDLEYNRNCGKMKSIRGQKITYPDIIVHERGNNNKNTIVIEFKKWNNNKIEDIEKDRKKLQGFKYEYGYKLSMLIILHKQSAKKVIYEII